ncbi:MAG: YdcF family protein [Candidatus Eiseniibacteriota bacterium]
MVGDRRLADSAVTAEAPRRSSPWVWVVRGLALIVIAWVAGFVWFAQTMPGEVPTDVTPTDAIVVLTGGSERLGEGLKLLLQNRAAHLFVSGVHPGVTVEELLRVYHVDPARAPGDITIGYRAGNTQGNAEETAEWMAAHGFHSLRLVTANYHMRRSLLEFSAALPGVAIVPHPVFPEPVYPSRWWRSVQAISVVGGEYNKYLVALARLLISGAPTPPADAAK